MLLIALITAAKKLVNRIVTQTAVSIANNVVLTISSMLNLICTESITISIKIVSRIAVMGAALKIAAVTVTAKDARIAIVVVVFVMTVTVIVKDVTLDVPDATSSEIILYLLKKIRVDINIGYFFSPFYHNLHSF